MPTLVTLFMGLLACLVDVRSLFAFSATRLLAYVIVSKSRKFTEE